MVEKGLTNLGGRCKLEYMFHRMNIWNKNLDIKDSEQH
ncbi:hypothetical protein HCH_01165 [Hahella chejuensis KCTC 2396]|uniref:Uncharacterized protein n=1 Tax=Hahella chejuensis (strain KCTC 2396) TaxID=349521 RepID=Q2SMT2_HAHCH|nr:hypothetical protein HCH_01165 [Hahella chejuensis KCTC 2396]